MHDSAPDTIKHIGRVQQLLMQVIDQLGARALAHDKSKLEEPEKSLFDEVIPLLEGVEYGSEAYRVILRRIKPATQHHYAVNCHHPEHYANGIAGMTLIDLVEMFCDWKAASERHATGNIGQSMAINVVRFAISEQVAQILANTARELGWIDGSET